MGIFSPLKIVFKNVLILFSHNVGKKVVEVKGKIKNVFFSNYGDFYNVYDNKIIDFRVEYIKRFKILENPDIRIQRYEINIQNFFQKLLIIYIQITSFVLVFPLYILCTGKRAVICLYFLQFLEWVSILNSLIKFKGKTLYMFDAYENDSDFISFLAMSESYDVYIFPQSSIN